LGVAADTVVPRASYPDLYDYEPGLFLYRATSFPLKDLPAFEKRLEIDDPAYNKLKPAERVKQIHDTYASQGAAGLATAQGTQSRQTLAARLTLSVSEELGQVTIQEKYGSTHLGEENPTLRILAVITPEPGKDPVLLMRKALPGWAQKEAGLFGPPSPSQVRWYVVGHNEGKPRYFEIVDRAALAIAARKWNEQAKLAPSSDLEIYNTGLKTLTDQSALKEDLVMPVLADFNSESIAWERALREAARHAGEPGYQRLLETQTKRLKVTVAPLLAHRKDPRVQHAVMLLREHRRSRMEAVGEYKSSPTAKSVSGKIDEMLASLSLP
jgi:hypothetical protein